MKIRVKQDAPVLPLVVPILLAFFLLATFDKDTAALADLINWRILPAILIYTLPTLVVCALLFEYLVLRISFIKAWALACIIGIPFTFGVIMLVAIWIGG